MVDIEMLLLQLISFLFYSYFNYTNFSFAFPASLVYISSSLLGFLQYTNVFSSTVK